ncbi:heavy-metal-associated domain-containing protein [Profundibacter sp.]|uniref:heavy-metal-associated domain-containing protein n=1 Tax=Profundibacter sp. TaxID=3101071 RepID=UPI003D12C749
MTKLNVPDMTCGHCKAAVEKAVASVDADAKVAVDLETRTVEIDTNGDMAAIMAALKEEGYEATQA